MTGQTLLDTMELLHPELQLQSGESDVAHGLLALNIAQDHLEAMLATIPGCMGGQVGTISTAANTETVAFPSSLLRLDKLQFIDPQSNKPIYSLTPLYNPGGHVAGAIWPEILSTSNSLTGRPTAYWLDGTNFYFAPTPDNIYTIRYYGFISAADITAGGTFAYKDIARMPLALFAVKILSVGIADTQEDYVALASEVFKPVLRAYQNFRAEQGKGLQYKYSHDT